MSQLSLSEIPSQREIPQEAQEDAEEFLRRWKRIDTRQRELLDTSEREESPEAE